MVGKNTGIFGVKICWRRSWLLLLAVSRSHKKYKNFISDLSFL